MLKKQKENNKFDVVSIYNRNKGHSLIECLFCLKSSIKKSDFLARFLIKNSLVFEGNNYFCYMILSCDLRRF